MYILEGNMGAGKSTFLELLHKKHPHIAVHQEPVDNWATSPFGSSLLEQYFSNPTRWEYTIETYIMFCRFKDHQKIQVLPNPNIVMERSIYAGHFCYAYMAKEAGYYTPVEWKIYNEWVQFFLSQCIPPRGFIYLKASPETCSARVKKRARVSEQNTPYSFITQIHKWLELYLIDRRNNFDSIKHIPVLVLDANADFTQDTQVFEKHARAIDTFMLETQSLARREHSTLGREYK